MYQGVHSVPLVAQYRIFYYFQRSDEQNLENKPDSEECSKLSADLCPCQGCPYTVRGANDSQRSSVVALDSTRSFGVDAN